ncbi:MAG TPA: acyltransferase [Dermatophilaceae bacterium]|nr:acyltransferase [Dermatophilaceae bacterium]
MGRRGLDGQDTQDTGSGSGAGSEDRQLYLDHLKALLIAAIVAIHAVLSYSTLEVWTYTGVREVTLNPAVEGLLLLGGVPFGLFVIGLLFLAAGLLSRPSIDRKGPRRFARDRLVRLGVPFAAYLLVVQPVAVYALEHQFGDARGSFWEEYVGEEGTLDSGPLWFVQVLLAFSLMYAALRATHRPAPRAGRGPVRMRHLLLAALAVGVASFLIRLRFPYGGESGFTDANFWQWPACATLFGLGLVTWERGWLVSVPGDLVRRCRTVTLVAVAGAAVLLAAAGFADRFDSMLGGASWWAAAFAGVDALLNLVGPVWLLAVAQRRLDRPLRFAPEWVRRSAYAAFLVQTVALLAIAAAMRPLDVPAEVKAVLLVAAAVPASFGLGHLLVRSAALRRVL